jgi:hypothetical protein
MGKKFGARCAVRGGKIAGPGGTDKVPLQATAGEYVLPVKTVQAIGAPALDALVRQTNGKEPGPKVVQGTEHAAAGGEVGSGLVDKITSMFGFGAKPPPAPQPRPTTVSTPTPTPELLGTGMAAGAGDAIRNRRQQIDEAAGYVDGGEVLTQEEQDRQAIMKAGGDFALGAKKTAAAAADIFTLPVRGVMGAANTLLRVPNAFGANIPYIPESAFGGSSSSLTPYYDRMIREQQPASQPTPSQTIDAMTMASPTVRDPIASPAVAKPPVPPVKAAAGAPAPVAAKPPPSVTAPAPTQIMGTGYRNAAPSGSLASFFGAAMDQKQLATVEAIARQKDEANLNRAQEDKKLGAELDKAKVAGGAKTAENTKTAFEAERVRQILDLAAATKDPRAKAAILLGQASPTKKFETPIGIQPLPGEGPPRARVFDPQAGTVVEVPVQQRAQMRRGSDGKAYVMGADGKPMREATPEELAAVQQQGE